MFACAMFNSPFPARYTDTIDCFAVRSSNSTGVTTVGPCTTETPHSAESESERLSLSLSSPRSWVVGASSSKHAYFTGGYNEKAFAKSAVVGQFVDVFCHAWIRVDDDLYKREKIQIQE